MVKTNSTFRHPQINYSHDQFILYLLPPSVITSVVPHPFQNDTICILLSQVYKRNVSAPLPCGLCLLEEIDYYWHHYISIHFRVFNSLDYSLTLKIIKSPNQSKHSNHLRY